MKLVRGYGFLLEGIPPLPIWSSLARRGSPHARVVPERSFLPPPIDDASSAACPERGD